MAQKKEPMAKKRTDGPHLPVHRFIDPWHRDKRLFVPVRSRKLYREAPSGGE